MVLHLQFKYICKSSYMYMHACPVVWDSVTPWTVVCQASLSAEFSRQEYWSGCHFLLQGIFLTQGLNPCLL